MSVYEIEAINSLLKHENQRLRPALIEKKLRRNRSKSLLNVTDDDTDCKTKFYSPHKVQTLVEQNEAAAAEKEAQKVEKEAKRTAIVAAKKLQKAQREQNQADRQLSFDPRFICRSLP